MKFKFLIIFIFIGINLASLSLQECFNGIDKNFPTSGNEEIYQKILSENQSELNRNWLPQVFLTSMANYSSETTAIKLDLPPTMNVTFPEADKDREAISLEAKQQIYDGGVTSIQKKLKEQETEMKIYKNRSSLHQIKTLAASLYLSIILLEKTDNILQIQSENLQITLKSMQARFVEGLVEKNDVQALEYETLNLYDKIAEIGFNRNTALTKLTKICGLQLAENVNLEIPQINEQPAQRTFLRNELLGLKAQSELLDTQIQLSKTALFPRLIARGSYSLGKPGYDMFSTDYHTYYSAALSFSWNIWDFGKSHKKRLTLAFQKKLLENAEDELVMNLENQSDEFSEKIEFLKEKLNRTKIKVELMESIEKSFAAKLQEGTVSTDDYLMQSNKLMKIKTEQEQDKLNLLNAKIQQILLRGGSI